MKKTLEPTIIKLYRYFALVCGVYFFVILSYAALNFPQQRILWIQSNINIVTSVILVLYFSLPFLFRKRGKRYLPLGIAFHSASSAFSFGLNFLNPNLQLWEALNSIWSFMPVWLVLVVIVAWQYRFPAVLGFTFFVFCLNFGLTYRVIEQITLTNLQYLGLPFILGFAFVIVGTLITQLVRQEREQQAALIIANQKLVAYNMTLEDLSVSRERNRIARELHDTLSHTLSGTAINLEAVKVVLPRDSKKATEMIDTSLAAVREGLVETRRVLVDLRAASLEEYGLLASLQQLLENVRTREGLKVTQELPEFLNLLPSHVEHIFYRIAQEGLQNVVQHASAKNVFFQLQQPPNALNLVITDDGVGFDDTKIQRGSHLGLLGMQERAASIGAQLSIHAELGRGTKLSLQWKRAHD